MNEFGFENASQRKSFVGVLFDKGEKYYKNEVLDNLPSEWAELHRSGKIHIHDLEAYGLTYNCLTFNLLNKFLIFFIESVRIYKHFLKIKNILLQAASHFLYLHQVMPIMLIKHTFHTNRTRTLLTKILNTLALMPWTRNEISMILELRIIPPQ